MEAPSPMVTDSHEAVTGNSAPVQQTKVTLTASGRDLVWGTIMAISIITSLVLWSKLHDAEKDIQTQVWLRDDALTKFEQGPFSDIKARVLSLERDVCRKEK